ncbi:DegT/DnrJ/EryC1/StrS family aminotransferase [Algoriphagus namhaensis]
MEVPFLDLKRFDATLKADLMQAFQEMLDSGLYSGGKQLTCFEDWMKEQVGAAHVIPLGNGTDALELALRALGVQSGDEVIVPALTWVSTAEAVTLLGATPIFADTDEDGLISDTWTEHISSKTRVVIPVHLYGKMVEMDRLCQKADTLGLKVVEDAAQSFGAVQKGKPSGSWGDVGAFSFYPTKNLGALGEGGACVTDHPECADIIRLFSNHGQMKRDEHLIQGRNARMDSIQAGFLLILARYFEDFQTRRKELAQRYLDELGSIAELKLPESILRDDHNAHLFVVRCVQRDELRRYLSKNGIGTAVHYPQLIPDMKAFSQKGDFQTSRKLTQTILSLPLNPYLKDSEQEFVIEKIRKYFKH